MVRGRHHLRPDQTGFKGLMVEVSETKIKHKSEGTKEACNFRRHQKRKEQAQTGRL